MTAKGLDPIRLDDPLVQLQQQLAAAEGDASCLHDAISLLQQVGEAAQEAGHYPLKQCAALLRRLLELALPSSDEATPEASLLTFVQQHLGALQGLLAGQDDRSAWDHLQQQATEQWGDHLALLEASDAEDEQHGWNEWDSAPSPAGDAAADHPAADLSANQIDQLLAALRQPSHETSPTDAAPPPAADASPAPAHSPSPPNEGVQPPGVAQLDLDEETREAYLDDAQRCLASIESSLLDYEADTQNSQPLTQICRDLHTLKGASASVGLADLAAYLHRIEDRLAESCHDGQAADTQLLFTCVDVLRNQAACIAGPAPSEASAESREHPASEGPALLPANSSSSPSITDLADAGQDSMRVKAAQLDRLLDMLAELVMLRNRRDSRVECLKDINSELLHCVTRLRTFEERFPQWAQTAPAASAAALPSPVPFPQRLNSLTEVANDLLELGRRIRQLYEPVQDENLAISRFIRQFRHELSELRRTPMAGLFRRLQRAARDVARIEGKQVQVHFRGEHVGLERSVQEQLFDALLHIVRNAVSHGIEPPNERAEMGKHPAGTLWLEAHGGTSLLVLVVQDDGKGLDYDALRRRGVELGLLAANRPVSRDELARLIFHPGFSTRQQASEVSGRGVGMDVVATTLERMHGWVEVDSTPGNGATVRLTIPLRSVIEHALVFRVAGQHFAISTKAVKSIGTATHVTMPAGERAAHTISLRQILGLPPAESAPSQSLVLSYSSGEAADNTGRVPQRLILQVDSIVGPEEVVVRPLPPLIDNHPLMAGVTLAGTGEIMFLLDDQKLGERALSLARSNHPAPGPQAGRSCRDPASSRPRVLVVDDSLSARRHLIQQLRQYPLDLVEAVDGSEALEQLRSDDRFAAVFTDLEMPQMSGLDLLQAIRRTLPDRSLPVIIVTTRNDDELAAQAHQLGAAAYLIKPVNDTLLASVLKKQLAVTGPNG